MRAPRWITEFLPAEFKRIWILSVLLPALLAVCITASARGSRYSDRADVRAFVSDLAKEHKLNRAELLGMFRRAQRQQAVLDAISRPAEKQLTWAEYRPIFVTDTRAEQGAAYWRQHADILAQAEQRFGVPAEIIVAIIGVETRYGGGTGKYPVFDSLVTLGFDGETRTGFFRRELAEFLLLARDEQLDPFVINGSYAGAMGIPQFIASSYRMYAVDFDGDGKRDLFTNTADAVGSVANYFRRYGWDQQKPIALPVSLQNPAAAELAVGRERKGLKPESTIKQWQQAGIALSESVSDDELAVLLELEGKDGKEYWLGLKNFYVITRYNISSMYAMAVFQLSHLVKQKYLAAELNVQQAMQ